MLFYLFHYLLAAVLLFQGVQALGEQRQPTNIVPEEVRTNPAQAKLWGAFLAAYGSLMVLAGLASHFCEGCNGLLGGTRTLGFGVLAAYGLWLVFGRKVDYTPAPSAAVSGHGHH